MAEVYVDVVAKRGFEIWMRDFFVDITTPKSWHSQPLTSWVGGAPKRCDSRGSFTPEGADCRFRGTGESHRRGTRWGCNIQISTAVFITSVVTSVASYIVHKPGRSNMRVCVCVILRGFLLADTEYIYTIPSFARPQLLSLRQGYWGTWVRKLHNLLGGM